MAEAPWFTFLVIIGVVIFVIPLLKVLIERALSGLEHEP